MPLFVPARAAEELTGSVRGIVAQANAPYDYADDVIISELLPNPVGLDRDGEFIELYNAGGRAVRLRGWQLGDESARRYEIADVIIEPGAYRAWPREQTGIALNNGGDTVRLWQPEASGPLVSVSYQDSREGMSYALHPTTNAWQWTNTPTPGAHNFFEQDNEDNGNTDGRAALASEPAPPNGQTVVRAPGVEAVQQRRAGTAQSDAAAPAVVQAALETIRSIAPGTRVAVTGTVAVAPGVLASQYFYITGTAGGVQVYNYYKDFPALAVGQLVRVTGEISTVRNETRVKTKQAADIAIIASSTGALEPAIITTEEAGAAYEAQLVSVTGVITGRQGSTVWLDDSRGEIAVYVKKSTGIDMSVFEEGETVTVTGLYLRGGSGFRLYPRFAADIAAVRGVQTTAGETLPSAAAQNEWALEPQPSHSAVVWYAGLVSVAANVLLAAALWRQRQ